MWYRWATISIHALREEGDVQGNVGIYSPIKFLSTPSARRATLLLPLTAARSSIFLSTPSARRATHPALRRHRILRISIHALREEGDLLTCCSRSSRQCISIHALREEGDAKATEIEVEILNFYPRPPRGGRRVSGCEHHNLGRFLSTPSARRATYVGMMVEN